MLGIKDIKYNVLPIWMFARISHYKNDGFFSPTAWQLTQITFLQHFSYCEMFFWDCFICDIINSDVLECLINYVSPTIITGSLTVLGVIHKPWVPRAGGVPKSSWSSTISRSTWTAISTRKRERLKLQNIQKSVHSAWFMDVPHYKQRCNSVIHVG